MDNELVRVTNKGVLPRRAILTIGGVTIPWIEININMKVDEFTIIEVKTRAELVDIKALEENTHVVIEKGPGYEIPQETDNS